MEVSANHSQHLSKIVSPANVQWLGAMHCWMLGLRGATQNGYLRSASFCAFFWPFCTSGMPFGGQLRNIEDAMGAMRSLHQLLVQRFVELHGQASACDTLTSETEELKGEILRELAQRRADRHAELASAVEADQLEEYDPDDVEIVEVHDDATGVPTGSYKPKLFAPPLPTSLLTSVEITRATHHTEGKSCIICHEDVCYGQQLCKLPVCGHELCKGCCFEWLAICGSCPTCRRVIVAADFEPQSAPPSAPLSTPPPSLTQMESIIIPTASSEVKISAEEIRDGAPNVTRVSIPRPSSCSRLPNRSLLPPSQQLAPRPSSSSVASLRQRVAQAGAQTASSAAATTPTVMPTVSRHVGTSYDIFGLPDRRWMDGKPLHVRPSSAPATGNSCDANKFSRLETSAAVRQSPSFAAHVQQAQRYQPPVVSRSRLELAPTVQLSLCRQPPKGLFVGQQACDDKARPMLHPRPSSAAHASAHRVVVAANEYPSTTTMRIRPRGERCNSSGFKSSCLTGQRRFPTMQRHQNGGSLLSVDGLSISKALS